MKFVFHKPYPVAGDGDVEAIPQEMVRDPARVYRARRGAIAALERMRAAARREGLEIVVISSHRTFPEQSALFLDAERRHGRGQGILWVAPPGYSEHHTGFVFDLADRDHPETDDEPGFELTRCFAWLRDHAGEFGFEMSFPPGNWQSVGYEPWHWRYAGDEASRALFHPAPPRRLARLIQAFCNGIAFRLSL